MAELRVYQNATGPCIVCGSDSEGSPYWIGMPQTTWDKLRPYVSHLFQYSEWSKCVLEAKGFFVAPYDKPLCGPNCVGEYHDQAVREVQDKQG